MIDVTAVRGYVLVLLATLCGIVGMGLVFSGATAGMMLDVTIGLPLLFLGLWWSGIQLGRSQMAHRARRAQRRVHAAEQTSR
jgi:Zn-dependent protease with chaperone function